MVHTLKKFFKSINETCSYGLLLLALLVAAVILLCLLPALLQLAFILLAAFSK